jgi:hypothetical protein
LYWLKLGLGCSMKAGRRAETPMWNLERLIHPSIDRASQRIELDENLLPLLLPSDALILLCVLSSDISQRNKAALAGGLAASY